MAFTNLAENGNLCLDGFLKSIKLTRSSADPCVYFNKETELIVGVYVDDLLVMSNRYSTIQKFKNEIKAVFEVKDLGEIHHLLSIKITKNIDGSMTLSKCLH